MLPATVIMFHGYLNTARLLGCVSAATLTLAGCGATTITEHGKYQPKTTTQVVTVARTTTVSRTTTVTVPVTTTVKRTSTVTRTVTAAEYVPGPVETVTVATPGPVTTMTTVSPTRASARRQRSIPAGAFPVSTHVLHLVSSFTVSDRNVSCTLSGGGPSCVVFSRAWNTPPKLASCATGGAVFSVHGRAAATISCGTSNLAKIRKPVVASGTDVIYGVAYCEVRSFGVACAVRGGHGFTVSRSGYTLY